MQSSHNNACCHFIASKYQTPPHHLAQLRIFAYAILAVSLYARGKAFYTSFRNFNATFNPSSLNNRRSPTIRHSSYAAFRPSASHLKPFKLSLMQITSQPQYKSFLQNVLNSTLLVFVVFVVYVVVVRLYKCATHKQHEIPLRICQPLTDVPQISIRAVSFAI